MAYIYERAPICPECRRNTGEKRGRSGATGRHLRCRGMDCGHEWEIQPIAEEYRDEAGNVRARLIR
jgi:hypothetical protein